MRSGESTASREELALARAVLYRFASDLFREPLPEREAEWQRQSAGILASLEVCREAGSPAELAAALEACAAGAGGAALGAAPSPSPFETEWPPDAGELERFHHIRDIRELYRAFGLERFDGEQRADHLSVELAFMHLLCVKEAYAEENALADLARICRDAERRFLDEHLARWTPAFCAQLERLGENGLQRSAGRFVGLWLADERRRSAEAHDAARDEPRALGGSPADRCAGCQHTHPCAEPA